MKQVRTARRLLFNSKTSQGRPRRQHGCSRFLRQSRTRRDPVTPFMGSTPPLHGTRGVKWLWRFPPPASVFLFSAFPSIPFCVTYNMFVLFFWYYTYLRTSPTIDTGVFASSTHFIFDSQASFPPSAQDMHDAAADNSRCGYKYSPAVLLFSTRWLYLSYCYTPTGGF